MKVRLARAKLFSVVVGCVAALAGCGDNSHSARSDAGPPDGNPPDLYVLPARITNIVGPMTYDGTSDDLLTGGLGKTGLASTAAPGFADAANPTAAELRRRAKVGVDRAPADMARCMAPTSTSMAMTPWARARLPARKSWPTPTMAPARRMSR